MKRLILIVSLLGLVSVFSTSHSAIKCIRKADGSTCCWDTTVEGPYKPISCM